MAPDEQRLLITYCRRRRQAGKPFPDLERLRRYMGWEDTAMVVAALRRFEAFGLLRADGKTWELVPQPRGKRKLHPGQPSTPSTTGE